MNESLLNLDRADYQREDNHYLVTPEFDNVIHAFFQHNKLEGA
jgi:hypothetical protein